MNDGVAGGDGEDVGAGDGPRAHQLQQHLNLVDHLQTAQRPSVRPRPLFAGEAGRVVEQNGRVAPLLQRPSTDLPIISHQYTSQLLDTKIR